MEVPHWAPPFGHVFTPLVSHVKPEFPYVWSAFYPFYGILQHREFVSISPNNAVLRFPTYFAFLKIKSPAPKFYEKLSLNSRWLPMAPRTWSFLYPSMGPYGRPIRVPPGFLLGRGCRKHGHLPTAYLPYAKHTHAGLPIGHSALGHGR